MGTMFLRSRHQHHSGTDVTVVSAVWILETQMCMRNSNTDVFHCADDPYCQLCSEEIANWLSSLNHWRQTKCGSWIHISRTTNSMLVPQDRCEIFHSKSYIHETAQQSEPSGVHLLLLLKKLQELVKPLSNLREAKNFNYSMLFFTASMGRPLWKPISTS